MRRSSTTSSSTVREDAFSFLGACARRGTHHSISRHSQRMYCCRPRSTTKGRGISDHAPATTIGLADEGLHSGGPKKISPWSHYPPIETQPRHRVSRADIWDGRGDTDSTPLFDARKVRCFACLYARVSAGKMTVWFCTGQRGLQSAGIFNCQFDSRHAF